MREKKCRKNQRETKNPGKVFAAIIAILGIGMFALPTGILGASFVEEIDKMKPKENQCCPHCGEEIKLKESL